MYCNNSVPAASFRIPRAACERDIALDPSHSNARLLALQRARARTLDPSHSKTTRALEPSHSHDERYLLASFFLLAFKFRVSCTVSQAYQQVLLEEESRKYVTINTHKGLYRYNRLPFGITSAPAIFQQTMEKILQGLSGVTVYIDDILVTGRNDEEHLVALEAVLQQLSEYGLRLKREKCSFMQASVEYLGYIVDKDGLHATPAKVEAIVHAPRPRDVTELRSFLGLVNYYGKFISHLSTLIQPLNHLLCQNVTWEWSAECQQSV